MVISQNISPLNIYVCFLFTWDTSEIDLLHKELRVKYETQTQRGHNTKSMVKGYFLRLYF